MRIRLWSCALPLLLTAPLGCTATPGFQWSVSFTQPPVLRQPAPVTPIPAPTTAYAVEQVQPFVAYTRQPVLSPRMTAYPTEPVCPPGCAPSAPAPVPAAMPQQPCPPGCLPAAPMPRGPAKTPQSEE